MTRMVAPGVGQPVDEFDHACRHAVQYLRQIVPMGMWAVTRVEGDSSTVLVAEDDVYGVADGASLPFSELPCSFMVSGVSPSIAADARLVPEYVACGFAQNAPLGAYVGAPITTPSGELFGTVCGFDPLPQSPTLPRFRPLLDLVAMLLSAVLSADRSATANRRRAEALASEAETDPLTGLLNRRAWTRHLQTEQPRYRRFGDPAAVVVVDLDGLKNINDTAGHQQGDRHLVVAAEAMRSATRPNDVVARLGGDEFGIFLPDVSSDGAGTVVDRLATSFSAHGVAASIGWAPVTVSTGTASACVLADQRMYAAKRERRAQLT